METLQELVEEIKADFAQKDAEIESLKAANSRLLGANIQLKSRLDTARRSFGDAFVKGQHFPVGPKRPNRKKLTEVEVKDIRAAHRGGMSQKALAKNYGVNPATISRTVRGIYH